MDSLRFRLETPSARTAPDSICGLAVSAFENMAVICPLMTSVIAGAVPR